VTESLIRKASLSERTVSTAREVLSGQRRGMGAYLAFAGPAVVASIAYIDPGNFATNIQAGAKYGYGLLWVVLLANMIAMLFQALSAKLGIVTGRNLAEMCRDRFPRPVVWAMWVISEIAAMATDLAEFLGGAVEAAEPSGQPPPRAPTNALVTDDWTGFYVGGHLGYAAAHSNWSTQPNGAPNLNGWLDFFRAFDLFQGLFRRAFRPDTITPSGPEPALPSR
jgi:hypothetical protein